MEVNGLKDISLHILDIMQNSVAALAGRIGVRALVKPREGALEIIIEDDGGDVS